MKAPLLAALLLAPLVAAGCAAPAAEERLDRPVGGPADEVVTTNGWPDAATASVRPGVAIRTPERTCVSNFVFARPDNGSVFLGTTANCVRDVPVGGLVEVGPEKALGVVIYSSWATMDEIGETDPHAREYNDFAVLLIDSSSRPMVHPAIPGQGGPVRPAESGALPLGARVRAYVPTDVNAIAWREQVVTGHASGWALLAHAPLPGTPGTLGGGVVTPSGEAVGVLVNLGVFPNPGAHGIARLDSVMAYARAHAKLEMDLATWELFGPPGLGA